MQQLIVEIQIQVSWGVIIVEDKPPIKVALANQKIIKVFRTDNLNSHFRELAKIPIKVEAIKRVFANYPNSADKQIVLDCFQYGFRVQYDGPRLPFNCKNLVFAYQHD